MYYWVLAGAGLHQPNARKFWLEPREYGKTCIAYVPAKIVGCRILQNFYHGIQRQIWHLRVSKTKSSRRFHNSWNIIPRRYVCILDFWRWLSPKFIIGQNGIYHSSNLLIWKVEYFKYEIDEWKGKHATQGDSIEIGFSFKLVNIHLVRNITEVINKRFSNAFFCGI